MNGFADKPLKYDSYHDPIRAIAAGCLEGAVLEYQKFGQRRYRHRYHRGQDWKREFETRPNYVPPVYQQLRDLIWFVHTVRFAMMCELLGLDHEQVRYRLIEMLAGVPQDAVSWN